MTTADEKLLERAMNYAARSGNYFSRSAAEALLEGLLVAIADRLSHGQDVHLEHFGTLCTVTHKARTMKHPQTGKVYRIRHRRFLVIHTDMWMKSRINRRKGDM